MGSEELQIRVQMMTSEQLRLACRIGKIGTFTLDLDTFDAQWDTFFKELINVPPEHPDVTLEFYTKLVHPSNTVALKKRIKALSDGITTTYEAEYRLKPVGSNEWKWIHAKAEIIPDTRIMCGVIRDITDQKQEEEVLTKLLRNTEKSKSDIRTFLTSLNQLT